MGNIGNIIVGVINALGAFGEKGIHFVLDGIEDFVTKSETPVDNSLFYKVVVYIQSWKPKNFTE